MVESDQSHVSHMYYFTFIHTFGVFMIKSRSLLDVATTMRETCFSMLISFSSTSLARIESGMYL